MQKDYLAIELAKIEADAAALTASLLRRQDAFLRGHALAELLIAHGAPAETHMTVVDYGCDDLGFILFCDNARDMPEDVFNALQDTRLPYRIVAGFSEKVRCILVDGYEGARIALPAALFPALQEAA